MIVKEIHNKKEWENFWQSLDQKTFLQSWNWGEFQKQMKRKIWRLGLYEGTRLWGVCLVIKNPIFTIRKYQKNFLFCPHGPALTISDPSQRIAALRDLLAYLKKVAKAENVSFIRWAPFWPERETELRELPSLGFRKAPMFIHPELTWELDLRPSEENLLQAMRKTTRYLIKKGLKWPGLEVRQGISDEDLDIFWQLYQKTTTRHHFVPFSKDYLKKEIRSFEKDKEILIFSALFNKKPLASAIIIFWQGIAFYHHGASDTGHSKIPAAYLLQWKIIQEAKKRRCRLYNFWGITPSTDKNHPWWGLTLFKKGFGGQSQSYLKTHDLVLSWTYWLNWGIETLRRNKRKL